MQYLSFAAPTSVLAAHNEGVFELDGNAVNEAGVAGDDWQAVFAGTSSAFDVRFITDPVDDDNDDTFTGGSTKDDINITSWLWKKAKASQAKNDITHAFAAAYTVNGDTFAYFGLNKWEADGNNFAGFWFLKDGVGPTGPGTPPGSPFSGAHQVGDILVLASYTNGGSLAAFDIYKWVGSGGNVNGTLQTVASGIPCAGGAADVACGATNGSTITAPWPYDGRDGDPGEFPPATFFEGGINLTELGLDTGCFSSFVAETRSSQSVDATLSDFAHGQFSFCVEPDISTQVKQDGANVSSINMGESVVDTAIVSGDKGVAEGTVTFFVCGPTAHPNKPDCSTGGTQVGSAVTLSGGTATSASFTPSQVGWYCFRAAYAPAAGSKYLAASHTNLTTECFRVLPAQVQIDKTPDGQTVDAGSPIEFTISWSNTGEGQAKGVVVSDNLPAGDSLDWSIVAFTGTGSTCAIAGVVGAEVLTCTVGNLNADQDANSVTVRSATTGAECGVIDNTASITSTNDGTDNDPGQITVQCQDVAVTKSPDAGVIQASNQAAFSITVSNVGDGTATNVQLSDNLPAGLTWSLGTVSGNTGGVTCNVTGAAGSQTLTCSDPSMAAGDAFTVTVTAPTSGDTCLTYPNTATVSAGNETAGFQGNNTDNGQITVRCPDVAAAKTADDDGVNAGDQVGFTVTISNHGTGTALGATASDTLPGSGWSIESQDGGWTLVGNTLSFGPADLAPGASSSVHIVRTSSPADCGTLVNTVTVDASNESNAPAFTDDNTASADIDVACPDIVVVKTADDDTISAGENASFSILITNEGDGTAYDVSLSDTLPAGVTWSLGAIFVNGTQVANPNALCQIAGTALTCADLGDLDPGDEISIHVSGDTDLDDCGELTNTVTIAAANEAQADTGNNTDSATVLVDCPELAIDKDADHTVPVTIGGQIGFTITIQNNGEGTAFGVTVSDTLDGDFSWSIESETGAPDWTLTGTSLSFSGNLPAGGSSSVHVVAQTTAGNEAQCGVVPNTATLNHPSIDPTPASAAETVACPSIELVKTAGTAADGGTFTTLPGPVTYTYVVENTGNVALQDVTVTDDNGTPADTSDDFAATCPKTTLAVGESMTCTATVTVTANKTNIAVARGETSTGAPVEDSDPAVVVIRNPQLTIVKVNDAPLLAGLPTAQEGQTVTFTLTYDLTNGPVTSGVITDVLPVGLTYVTGSASGNDEFTFISFNAATRTLTWTAATVTKDGSVTYDAFPAAGAAELAQPLVNVATIDSAETAPDDDDSQVFVPAPPAGATATPRITLPPTDGIDGGSRPSNPGFALMLVLLFIAGLALVVGIVTPAPERVRRQRRRR